nr:protein kinase [Deltaproteobacteria bacterium]
PEPRTATEQGRAVATEPAVGLATGQQLGHFRIERPLGAGGMGEVYLATDLALDRPVAIKVLPDALARDPKRRERMVREARAQARVAHPNVGHIYYVGEEAGRLFFAMEYVSGETLADRIAKGPLSVDDALSVIRAAALGLREAQRSGFTHRDVKPSNLMLDSHGTLKVLDFGLAAGAPEGLGGGAACGGPVAQTSLAGTPLYMAPEQARGEAVDFRADIYALGATLYHLVSGKPPFNADSVDELISMHATAARPTVPRRGVARTQFGAVDALCTKMLAARPEDRFASYDELLRAIELASMAHTRPGGFWARSIATAIDFGFVMLVVSIVMSVAQLVGMPPVESTAIGFFTLFGYQVLTVARWGQTLGKAIFELEVVDLETSRRPGLARATRRSLAMLGVPALAIVAAEAFGFLELRLATQLALAVMGFAIFVGLASLLYASARISGKRALWDRAAHTMVRYRTTRTAAH